MDKRLNIFRILIGFFFFLLLLRFWYLQIYNGEKYLIYSRKNMVRKWRIPPVRGDIIDRNGKILAGTRPAYDLYLDTRFVKKPIVFLRKLGKKLNLPLVKNYLKNRYTGLELVKIAEDIPRDLLAWVEVHKVFYPELVVEVWYRRTYFKPYIPHVIGYIGKISEGELKEFKKYGLNYYYGDWVGKTGIERLFERSLRGKSGYIEALVDAQGHVLRRLKEVLPKPGREVSLTIDSDLQSEGEKLMDGKVGALVAVDPRNGEVLAWVSSPWYNPDAFARGIDPGEWEELAIDPLHPLENRVIRGAYPPGSTFKPIVALGALQSVIISPSYKIFCKGFYKKGKDTFRCWKKHGHGWTDLHKAIVQSCDVYFYTVGDMMGIDRIAYYAKLFGLGEHTGIELKGERTGLVPTPEWKKSVLKEPWYGGETIPVTIGQGYLLVTPLQMARAYSAIANRGFLPEIHVVKDTPPSGVTIPVERKYFEVVIKGMEGVVDEPHGTGWRARVRGVKVAGKTGTTQVIKEKEKNERKKKNIQYWHRDHGWFIAFAPVDRPEIVIAVLVEHGGHGGSSAAPIVGKFLRYYFSREKYAGN